MTVSFLKNAGLLFNFLIAFEANQGVTLIHLEYKQFVKISHETIAPWPLFPLTFIMGADGKRISQQYLILGISKTCSEELNSL